MSRLNKLIPHLPNHLPTQEVTTTHTQSEAILGWSASQRPGQSRPHTPTSARRIISRLGQLNYGGLRLHPIRSPTSSPTAPASNPNPNPVPVPSSGGKLKMRSQTIILGDGTQHVEFTADDVGPPPAISFTNNLPQLNRMWDDTSKYWDGHLVLVIKGVPIPIVYWKEGSWCEWKSIMKRWRQSSEQEFWKEFSDASGHKFSYTSIVDCLSQLQKEEDRKWADRTKDREIAKQFRQELAKQKQNLPPTAITDFADSDMDLDSD
ncbi:hypothetical protein BYT27DRAFT_7251107 [Phlegmacium glaucopus]|nr:hypothetical protein BYT27DRAFT_7251107 [Phlegmacium glaucopus]